MNPTPLGPLHSWAVAPPPPWRLCQKVLERRRVPLETVTKSLSQRDAPLAGTSMGRWIGCVPSLPTPKWCRCRCPQSRLFQLQPELEKLLLAFAEHVLGLSLILALAKFFSALNTAQSLRVTSACVFRGKFGQDLCLTRLRPLLVHQGEISEVREMCGSCCLFVLLSVASRSRRLSPSPLIGKVLPGQAFAGERRQTRLHDVVESQIA